MLSFEPGTDEDAIMLAALEAGVDDLVNNEDGSIDVLTAPEQLDVVKQAMIDAGLTPQVAELTMRASSTTPLGEKDSEKMLRLQELLEDLDDVQTVHSKAEIETELLQKLG